MLEIFQKLCCNLPVLLLFFVVFFASLKDPLRNLVILDHFFIRGISKFFRFSRFFLAENYRISQIMSRIISRDLNGNILENFLTKILIFEKKSNFWQKFQFLTKNPIFDTKSIFRQKIHFVDKKSIFWENFQFLRKFSILDENFQFLRKFSILDENFYLLTEILSILTTISISDFCDFRVLRNRSLLYFGLCWKHVF